MKKINKNKTIAILIIIGIAVALLFFKPGLFSIVPTAGLVGEWLFDNEEINFRSENNLILEPEWIMYEGVGYGFDRSEAVTMGPYLKCIGDGAFPGLLDLSPISSGKWISEVSGGELFICSNFMGGRVFSTSSEPGASNAITDISSVGGYENREITRNVFGATLTEDRFGNPNSAYSFDGDDDYIGDLGHYSSDITTISIWFSIDKDTGWKSIVSYDNFVTHYPVITVTGDKLLIYLAGDCYDYFESDLNINQWYHLVVIVNQEDKTNCNRVIDNSYYYLDGIKGSMSTGHTTDNFGIFSGDVRIGSRGNGGWNFDGSIDDVRIYGRELNEEEINELFNDKVVVEEIDLNKGLIGKWLFEGNADDTSGNGNDGVVSGAELTTDRFGNLDSAYEFNGDSDYIYADSDMGTPEEFTANFWILGYSDPGHDSYLFTSRKGKIYSPGVHCRTPSGSLNLRDDHNNRISINQECSNNYGKWRMYTLFNDGHVYKMYVDGELKGVSNEEWAPHFKDGILFGGLDGLPVSLDGKMDDVRFYDRELSEEEKTMLFNEPKKIKPIEEPSQQITLGDSSKIRRVCYSRGKNTCSAEVRTIELPCDFIVLDNCLNSLNKKTEITLFEWIFG